VLIFLDGNDDFKNKKRNKQNVFKSFLPEDCSHAQYCAASYPRLGDASVFCELSNAPSKFFHETTDEGLEEAVVDVPWTKTPKLTIDDFAIDGYNVKVRFYEYQKKNKKGGNKFHLGVSYGRQLITTNIYKHLPVSSLKSNVLAVMHIPEKAEVDAKFTRKDDGYGYGIMCQMPHFLKDKLKDRNTDDFQRLVGPETRLTFEVDGQQVNHFAANEQTVAEDELETVKTGRATFALAGDDEDSYSVNVYVPISCEDKNVFEKIKKDTTLKVTLNFLPFWPMEPCKTQFIQDELPDSQYLKDIVDGLKDEYIKKLPDAVKQIQPRKTPKRSKTPKQHVCVMFGQSYMDTLITTYQEVELSIVDFGRPKPTVWLVSSINVPIPNTWKVKFTLKVKEIKKIIKSAAKERIGFWEYVVSNQQAIVNPENDKDKQQIASKTEVLSTMEEKKLKKIQNELQVMYDVDVMEFYHKKTLPSDSTSFGAKKRKLTNKNGRRSKKPRTEEQEEQEQDQEQDQEQEQEQDQEQDQEQEQEQEQERINQSLVEQGQYDNLREQVEKLEKTCNELNLKCASFQEENRKLKSINDQLVNETSQLRHDRDEIKGIINKVSSGRNIVRGRPELVNALKEIRQQVE